MCTSVVPRLMVCCTCDRDEVIWVLVCMFVAPLACSGDQQFQLSQFTYSSPALKDFKFDMEDILTPFSLSVRSVKI